MPTYTVTDPFSLLMLMIQDALADVTGLDQVVKDMGQLETKDSPDIMPYTALVSFEGWTFSDEGKLIQMGQGDVIIKTTGPMVAAIDSVTPVTPKENALKYLALAHRVFLKVHGKENLWPSDAMQDIMGKMTRVAFTEDLRRTGLGVAVSRYRMTFEDRSAMTSTTKTTVTPAINVEFED